jgi:hypothetical protein
LLLGDQERAAAEEQTADGGGMAASHQAQKGQRGVEDLRRRLHKRPPASFPGFAFPEQFDALVFDRNTFGGGKGAGGHHQDRGMGDGSDFVVAHPASGSIDGLSEGNRIGGPQAIAGQVRRQQPAIGRGRSWLVLPLQRPRSIAGLIEREPLGSAEEGLTTIDGACPPCCREGRRELDAGQALV